MTQPKQYYFTKELSCNLQNVKVVKVKERLNCFRLKEVKETQGEMQGNILNWILFMRCYLLQQLAKLE